MLDAIRQFFDREISDSEQRETQRQSALHLAIAALLTEIARMDGTITSDERAKIDAIVQRRFQLDSEQTRELIDMAERQARDATDYFQFTSLINTHYTPRQKARLIELLWQVVYSDGRADSYEEHLVRKVAALIYVPHEVFIAAKLRAREASTPQ
jgi:uncharacterized tellurite resistance protein B-like protein